MRLPQETSTLEHPEAPAPTLLMPTFRFEVVSDPERGRRFVFEPTTSRRAHLGRSETSDFHLTDPLVSLRHAALDFSRGHLRLTDLESRNGTFVEDLRVGNVYLAGGETIRVGATLLRLDVDVTRTTVTLPNVTRFGRVIGASPEMRCLYVWCERFALEDHPVLIEGEAGTGKELLAEALHEVGPRAGGPFVVFDCATTAPELHEERLFGGDGHPGVFEQADGGTLLLEDVGDLDPRVQAELLRVINDGKVKRVDGSSPIRVDVRVLATTGRDLERDVETGHFRADLHGRLARKRLELPPLRHRVRSTRPQRSGEESRKTSLPRASVA